MKAIVFSALLAIFNLPTAAQVPSVYSTTGNVVLKAPNGSEKQLTVSGHDSYPSLSPDTRMAVFVRATANPPIDTGSGEGLFTELWILNVGTGQKEKLLDSTASDNMKEVLAGFSSPQFSNDAKAIFFLSQAWATSFSVQRFDRKTKTVKFVTHGNSLVVVREGPNRGFLRVNQHRYKKSGAGSYDCEYIFTPEGKEIKRVQGSCNE